MSKITGNTFQHRDLLRSINAKWNADEKCWVVRSITPSDLERLKSIVGIVVSEKQSPVPPAPMQFDNPLEMFEQRRQRPRKNAVGNTEPKIYGDDETYFNYFKDHPYENKKTALPLGLVCALIIAVFTSWKTIENSDEQFAGLPPFQW